LRLPQERQLRRGVAAVRRLPPRRRGQGGQRGLHRAQHDQRVRQLPQPQLVGLRGPRRRRAGRVRARVGVPMRFAAALAIAALAAPQAWAKPKDDEDDDEEEEVKPKKKAKPKVEDDDADFKKQDLTGHDLGTTKKENVFERDRFFVDKTDTDK